MVLAHLENAAWKWSNWRSTIDSDHMTHVKPIIIHSRSNFFSSSCDGYHFALKYWLICVAEHTKNAWWPSRSAHQICVPSRPAYFPKLSRPVPLRDGTGKIPRSAGLWSRRTHRIGLKYHTFESLVQKIRELATVYRVEAHKMCHAGVLNVFNNEMFPSRRR